MKIVTAFFLIGIVSSAATAQQLFSVSAYEQFLAAHQDMRSSQLMSLYSAGLFKSQSQTNYASAAYFDSIDTKYSLTPDEKTLLGEHGFMVTERLDNSNFGGSFGDAFLDIYHKDLTVFVSTDAILQSIHMSYDQILMSVEMQTLIPDVKNLLAQLQGQLPALASKYAAYPAMKPMLNDVDVYLSVPRMLLGAATGPTFSENTGTVDTLLSLIAAEQPANYPLFSATPRAIDFSQFTPRGHYTATPELTQYFQAMMWLGRIEIYLIPPVSAGLPPQSDADIQRQTIDAMLIKELVDASSSGPLYVEMDSILTFFVGKQDNVTLPEIDSVAHDAGIQNASDLLDTLRWRAFQDTLSTKPYAFQSILSQILGSDPYSPQRIKTASSFLLFGQRFVIDSYIMENVVYDKIVVNGVPIRRMLPSSLDVLFAEGNDAAAQLLKPQLDEYDYSTNLAALRYLIDYYSQNFWQSSMYDLWSNAIRSLNPPASRDSLPAFMQTAAWWQEKMNTQLASWAELRHDNLLYAKESYSGAVVTCSYPESYVEPDPQFYDAVKTYAAVAQQEFEKPFLQDYAASSYFGYVEAIADTLGNISREELSGTPLSQSERTFLENMMYTVHSDECGSLPYDGWYPKLFYQETSVVTRNFVVADVHTAPTDSLGHPVGWVFHVGTGPINLAVVIATPPGGVSTAFVGPVMSYYEHLSTNFQRLTDQEWQSMYNVYPSLRPSWVNVYLADTTGTALPSGASLLTGINDSHTGKAFPTTLTLDQNFPNPFNPSTIIAFTIPASLADTHVEVTVYNDLGQAVKTLLSEQLQAGNYTVRWDGTNEAGAAAASGVYFYRLQAGALTFTRKMLLLR